MGELTKDDNGVAAQVIRLGRTQNVAYTDTAGTISDPLSTNSDSTIIRVYCTTDAHIKVGTNPTATTSDVPVAANVPEYFGASKGQKVSAVRQSGANSGTLFVTEPA